MPPVPSSSPALPEPAGSPETTNGTPGSLFTAPGSIPSASPSPGFQDLLQGNGQTAPVIRKSSTSTSLQTLQDKINYRTAKARAVQEPKLEQELAVAQAQITEPEFRDAMRAYYHDLHDRVVTLDPGTKTIADTVLSQNLQHLNQSRIRTTTAQDVRAARVHH